MRPKSGRGRSDLKRERFGPLLDRFGPLLAQKRPKTLNLGPLTPPKPRSGPFWPTFGQNRPKTTPKRPKARVYPYFGPFWTFWTRFDRFGPRFARSGEFWTSKKAVLGGRGPLMGPPPPTILGRFFDLLYLYKTLVIAFWGVTPLTPQNPFFRGVGV